MTGRVLDPDGKPVKGAAVDVVTRPRKVWDAASETTTDFTMLGQGETDGDGRFRLETPRTTSTEFFEMIALGTAPGIRTRLGRLEPRRRASRALTSDSGPSRSSASSSWMSAACRPPASRSASGAWDGRTTKENSTASGSGRARPRSHPRLAASGEDRRPGEARALRDRPRPRRHPERP